MQPSKRFLHEIIRKRIDQMFENENVWEEIKFVLAN